MQLLRDIEVFGCESWGWRENFKGWLWQLRRGVGCTEETSRRPCEVGAGGLAVILYGLLNKASHEEFLYRNKSLGPWDA